MKLTKEQEILKILFKDFLVEYNSRSISKVVGISHAGAFKILKRLEKNEIVKSKRIGKTLVYSLNTKNELTKRMIEMILTLEAQLYKRWLEEFKQLEKNIVILFGSIIRNEKNAKDIDILVLSKENDFNEIRLLIKGKNQISYKKIHLILQSVDEFKEDTNKNNKATIEILKTGIVLYGQSELVKILGDLR